MSKNSRKIKRGHEQDIGLNKVSPPNKMVRGKDAFETEVLAKLASIEARFVTLEAEVSRIAGVLEGLEALREEVRAETEAMRETRESFHRMEIEAKKRSVLVRGLKFRSQEKYETRQQTKDALGEFFTQLDFMPHLVDYQRLGSPRAGEDGSAISIRIQFDDVDQRLEFFEKLKVKGGELKHVSILTDYPRFQLQEFKTLSGAAYKIRTESPGTKTRIVPRGLGLQLQKRANASSRWTAVSGQ